MFPFNKIILVALAVLALGVSAAVAASRGGGSDDPVGATIPMATPTATVDVKGPCDEAEHVSDPRCAGAQVPEDDDVNAEANDANDDNGLADDDGANHDLNDDNGQAEDDNSGPSASSGPGNGGVDDNSGSGSGEDGGHSGSGGGGTDD